MKMTLRRLLLLLAVSGRLLLLMPCATEAQKKKDPKKEEQDKQQAMESYKKDLFLAYRLKELGNDDKNPQPEQLIAAARIFRRLSKVQLDKFDVAPKSEAEKDAKPDDKVSEPNYKGPDLGQEAKDLLEQARIQGATLNLGLDKLIKHVESENTRATAGGPRTVGRQLTTQQSHTYPYQVLPRTPVAFAFRSTVPMRVSVVRADIDNSWALGIITAVQTIFQPGASSTGTVPVTIRVTNVAPGPGQYQLFIN